MHSATDPPVPPSPEALAEIENHRAARERRLKSEDGWLSLIARHVLFEGDNTFDVAMDGASRTARAVRTGDVVTLALPDGRTHTWTPGDNSAPHVWLGSQRFELLRQGDKIAIRVRDPQSPARLAFEHLDFYAPDARFRVVARLSGEPKTIPMATGLGAEVHEHCPGTLHMSLLGTRVTLDPIIEADAPHKLFILFRDLTSKDTTYGAGRFLYAPLPNAEGDVVIDFNQAYNPPCALTEHAACPVTPPQNVIPLRVEAGEKRFELPGAPPSSGH